LYDARTDPNTSFSAYCWSLCGCTGDHYAKVCCYLTVMNLMVQPLVTVGTCSPVQVDPTGECSNANRVFARDGNSSVNLASQGHCAGVFIGI
jgi:hypothetical protein